MIKSKNAQLKVCLAAKSGCLRSVSKACANYFLVSLKRIAVPASNIGVCGAVVLRMALDSGEASAFESLTGDHISQF